MGTTIVQLTEWGAKDEELVSVLSVKGLELLVLSLLGFLLNFDIQLTEDYVLINLWVLRKPSSIHLMSHNETSGAMWILPRPFMKQIFIGSLLCIRLGLVSREEQMGHFPCPHGVYILVGDR